MDDRFEPERVKKPVSIAVATLALTVVLVALFFAAAERHPNWIRHAIAVRFPKVQWIDTATLSQWLGRSSGRRPVVLDVRTREEYAVSHLGQARRLDPDRPDIERLHIAADGTVVVYCSVGYRSAAVVAALEREGVHEVYNLEGGIFQWAAEGRPVYRDGVLVKQVHPYDRVWGRLLPRELRAPLGPEEPSP
ncbi:MAG: rhodanese-like domain-containing protein [Myxococcales bacterium]|nr:rhodanese-like domain-containing protein [Myxococcales bacterium]